LQALFGKSIALSYFNYLLEHSINVADEAIVPYSSWGIPGHGRNCQYHENGDTE
jgi:hypothetical protein